MYRKLTTLILSSIILVGCATRISHDEDPAKGVVINHEEVYPVIHSFIKVLSGSMKPDEAMSVVSLPFWVDDWISDEKVLLDEMAGDLEEDDLTGIDLKLRVYPFDDLSVLLPDVWEKLKLSPKLYLKDLYLGAIAIKLKDEARTENGYILLRRVEGKWKIAGLIER